MGRLTTLKPRLASADLRTAAPPPKVADEFYRSREWREARDLCIERANHRCAKCPRVATRLFADHIVELQDGGAPLSQANLQALCGSCHTTKTAEARARRMQALHRPVAGRAHSRSGAEGVGGISLPGAPAT